MGPVASLLLPQQLLPEQVSRIRPILKKSAGLRMSRDYADVHDVARPGYEHLGTFRPAAMDKGVFWVSLGALDQEELADEVRGVEEVLGWRPKQAIEIFSGSNDGDRLLGRAMHSLAETFGGLVAMHGAITPPYRAGFSPDLKQYTLEEVSAYVHGFPGRAYERYYKLWSGQRWVSHYVDAEFMRAWLRDRNFHMIN